MPTNQFDALTVYSEEEQSFFSHVIQFAKKEIYPLVAKMDEQAKFDPTLLSLLFQQGLMAIDVPEKYGGVGGTFMQSILAIQAISRVDPSVGVVVDVQNTLANQAFLRFGTEDLKQRYLPQMAQHGLCSYALSEASSGSDAFALQTRAREDGDHYVLSGRKIFITSAEEAKYYIVFANVNPSIGYKGITAFVVERQQAGFSIGKKENKMGIRASSTCELILEEVRVHKHNLLGQVGLGYKIAIETLNDGRIGIAAQMLGLAEGAFQLAQAYVRERKQFGRPLFDFQAVQFQLAEMATQIEASRVLVYNAARLKMNGHPYIKEAAMAKYHASETAERVASRSLELFGGYGYMRDYPIEKYYRDAKIGKIYEGTSNIQLQSIAKLL